MARLHWLAGCWTDHRPNGTTITERWTSANGALRGTSVTRRGDRVVESEVMRIAADGARVTFFAEPSGQQPASFRAAAVTDTLVVFDNPAHDFPQRISYRRAGADSLHARVEGRTSRGERHLDFRYGRATVCE